MLNKVMIIGTLGRDPEVRTLNSGEKVANLSIATTEKWKDKQSGERKEKTEWHRCTLWGPIAGIAEQYLQKGSKAYVCGKLETRKWQDQSGQDRYTTEVVVRPFGGELVLLGDPAGAQRDQGGYRDQQPDPGPDLDDDIPF